jgi:tRNA pseudouridine38-40 synthase
MTATPRNIRLLVEYDGTAYAGWQRQPNGPTVQEVLETACADLTGAPVTLHGSGRTDAGVHALGQVATFQTRATVPADRFAPALNTRLPPDVVVRASAEVDPAFHARFSARGKAYLYEVRTGPVRPALRRNQAHHVAEVLDVDAMAAAARRFLGTHDFRGFASTGRPVEDPRRTVDGVELLGRGDGLFFRVSADGFLYKMVRTLVGTLLAVGLGKLGTADIEAALATADRDRAGPTAPARGLTLLGVRYEDWETPLAQASLSDLLSSGVIFC